jgi:hypothetical protein
MRSVSHVPTLHLDLKPTLWKLLQQLGSGDPKAVHYTLGIISNLAARNKENKVSKRVIDGDEPYLRTICIDVVRYRVLSE